MPVQFKFFIISEKNHEDAEADLNRFIRSKRVLWGWKVDKIAPDRFDVIGGMVALFGVAIIMYWPRDYS